MYISKIPVPENFIDLNASVHLCIKINYALSIGILN
jgi:hypothetical protein